MEFFKLKEVRDVFQTANRENNPRAWLEKGQAIAQHRLSSQLPEIDPRWELGAFAAVFTELVKQTRTPKEIRADQKLDGLQQSLQILQSQIQQLPSLEGMNQLVTQLSGVKTPALPAAAQESNAAELAHRLGEWFAVLEYERVPDYEVWTEDYFEWAIDFPVTRRRVSRTLVRGVAGAVEMADLQSFAKAIEAAGADEGWLVGNRRVSKAARQAAADEGGYEEISCYTFDELIDEDADFSKYLDWLEADIKRRGVDVGYLPLACRKDELDPVSQRKIGVSTYAEEDGWIDGYVDMWLDDPAKEHLSVLGEFGTGKTWFALHYAWVTLQRYRDAKRRGIERPRVPIVVPLRDYAKAVSVESLFSEFFFRKHEILKNYSVFEQLNRMGKLLLIFDGFDEMAARVDRQAMIDNFWELARVVVPGAKAILTCRTEHFPDAIQGRQLLSAELASSTAELTGETPQFEVLELEKFEDEQIEQLLQRQAQAPTVREVMTNPQLLDLARRPVMVELILEALPDIAAGKRVDMSRVYLYAVTRKMEKDITSARTFTSMADKLYFLCELSWEMLTTDQMSLNYRAFPARLKAMFSDRMQDESELDHWRYDMMGQTMLIRNSEGDYSPAHRSLLEFFVAYKTVALLGGMAEDFTKIAREQKHIDETLPPQSYTWDTYFKRTIDRSGEPQAIAPINCFERNSIDYLLSLVGNSTLAKAVLDLAAPMLDKSALHTQLLPLVQATRQKTLTAAGYLGGNVIQMMLAKSSQCLVEADLGGVKLRGVDFSKALLARTNFQSAHFSEVSFPKFLGRIHAIAYSPNNKYLAIADDRGSLQVWSTSGQVMFIRSEHDYYPIESVEYSPDGSQIATAGGDLVVRLWDASSGECLQELTGHERWIDSLAYSPDGSQIAAGSGGGTVKLWDVATGECTQALSAHDGNVRDLAYSPDGMQLATVGNDATLKLWDLARGLCTSTLKGHTDWVRAVAYHPSGQQIATGSGDNTVKIWDVLTGDCLRTLEGHSSRVSSVAYRSDGAQLATGSYDWTVRLWDALSGMCTHTLKAHRDWVRCVAYSSDGAQLVSGSGDETVNVWDAKSGLRVRMLAGHADRIRQAVCSPDGDVVAICGGSSVIRLWNVKDQQYFDFLEGHQDTVFAVAYRADGQQIVSIANDDTIKVWDTASHTCIQSVQTNITRMRQLTYVPNRDWVATDGQNSDAKVWDIKTGKCIFTLEGHTDFVRSIAHSPDGKYLTTGSGDSTIKLWDVETETCVRTLKGHTSWVRSLSYSPDSKRLLAGSSDGVVKLWDVESGACLCTLAGHRNLVRAVAHSPNKPQAATGGSDKTIKPWNLSDGTCTQVLKGHEDQIRSMVYSPDGARLVSASSDDTVRVWDVTTGECVCVIDERVCAGLNITDSVGLTEGQRTVLQLMGAVDRSDES